MKIQVEGESFNDSQTVAAKLNDDSFIGIRYVKLFEAATIHVQIVRFTCCLNMDFNLTKPI